MGIKTTMLLLFLWYGSLLADGILSREEDLELERELQRLTKPAVESIKTIYGDTYDCVDFYQQPAFDDPLMKNHSLHPQMEQTSYSERMCSKNVTCDFKPEKIWVNGKGCPTGTVPIKKITKDDLLRAKQAADIYASNLNPQTRERPGVHFAVLHTPRLQTKVKYYGAGMHNQLCSPKLNHDSQYSSAQVKIQNGHESIIVGWTVHPKVYKDYQTRLFIYTYAKDKHCFNDFCGLFIKTSPNIPLDFVYNRISPVCQELVLSQELMVQKDEASGNWILKIVNGQVIGMWPAKFFTGLGNFATYLEWGGEVYSPSHIPSPQMGTGFPPSNQGRKCCAICDDLRLVNEDKKIVSAMGLVKYEDVNKYYQIDDKGYDPIHKHAMCYGGKGGYIGN